ncbi:hypothetical protein DV451_003040 [Geotrichum candidum]|uniref:Large ribosomal subunit protein uL2m n=1 Tax=Geotrichum candidum TaxID=1173061 RepID=A0A0J9X3Z5_GEOCN|nr:hypothetical protein DV451_003040 [Geotrichum candidum]KAI9212667.1 hypothetical protein DS838_002468 [Geotrichum bryndzae]KAF5108583.1 hypothetical protein DV453_002176 [Geotrichum candidum]KAF5117412.1 hypothetical protein DV454_001081 [Geotrichum candidum]KAF5117747.1 hypothetical protein DV452_002245 [Geotrichum candidum]
MASSLSLLSRTFRPLVGRSAVLSAPGARAFSATPRAGQQQESDSAPAAAADAAAATEAVKHSTTKRQRTRPTAKNTAAATAKANAAADNVLEELKALQIVPLGQQINKTDLEKQDDALKVRLKLAKAAVQMKTKYPSSPSLRWYRTPVYPYLHKGKPVKELTLPRKKHSGRNNRGRITVRHQGGGHKQRIRKVDFFRRTMGKQTVVRIEYDPGRSAHIALVEHNKTGALSYILACEGLRAGDVVESFRSGIPQDLIDTMGGTLDTAMLSSHTAQRGNCLPLRLIPLGTIVHNIGITATGPGKLCRSAGTYGRLFELHPETNRAVIRLQSGEYRYVALNACATIGIVSNPDHQHRSLGKAGRARNLGIRPSVRGVAMNKIDHPHGGGRGKSKGNKISMSKWGVKAKSGFKTRRGKNVNRMLVKDRPRGKDKKSGRA